MSTLQWLVFVNFTVCPCPKYSSPFSFLLGSVINIINWERGLQSVLATDTCFQFIPVFLFLYLHHYNLTGQKISALKLRFCRIYLWCMFNVQSKKLGFLIKTNISDTATALWKCWLLGVKTKRIHHLTGGLG